MSDVFRVPPPSLEAGKAYLKAMGEPPGNFEYCVGAAYAVDVPRIVVGELQAYFEWERKAYKTYIEQLKSLGPTAPVSHPASPNGRLAYLAARFPEPPEGKQCLAAGNLGRCVLAAGHSTDHQFYTVTPLGVSVSAPSAETATPEPEKLKCDCISHTDEPGSIHQSGCATVFTPTVYCTACPCARCQAERSFLEALAHAEVACDGIEIDVPVTTNQAFRGAIAAAKAFLRVTEGR